MLIRKHSLGKWNCFTLQVFTVLVSAGAQFNFADSDYNLPNNWKKCLDKIMPRTLPLSWLLQRGQNPFCCPETHQASQWQWGLLWTRGCSMAQCTAQTQQNRSWKAVTVTWPRTSYLSQRAAEAGSQCKCSCCLHHPLVAGSGHPRHIWHSLHSGLSHLSQSLCQLSPAWKDSKHQDFFWALLDPELEPHHGTAQPSPAPADPLLWAISTVWTLCFAVSANSNCTSSQIRKPFWTKQTFSIASWSEIPPCPPCFTMCPWQAQSRERERWKPMAWGVQDCFFCC